jgi:HJR/Mrr/RecB family endonuclease
VVLDAMLTGKRALSKEIVVPTTMTEDDFRAMFSTLVGDKAEAACSGRRPLDTMGWKDFEVWTATQFAQAGYQPNTTPTSHDGGADIILRPPSRPPGSRPVICQCKHRSLGEGQVDEDAVRDVLRARSAYGLLYPWLKDPRLMAVTNGRFTLKASSLARENDVVLVDGAQIDGLTGIARALL